MDTLIGVVPDEWRQVLLGDICEVTAGPSGAMMRFTDDRSAGVPIVVPKNIRNNRISADDLKLVNEDAAVKLVRYRLAAGDVVCVRTGEPGRHAPVSVEQVDWLFGTACLRLRPGASMTGQYLSHYLGHPVVQDWIDRNSSGSAIRNLSAGTLVQLPVIVPPVISQRKIGDILSALDAKVEIHEQVSRTTSALRDSLLPLLVTGAFHPPTFDQPWLRGDVEDHPPE